MIHLEINDALWGIYTVLGKNKTFINNNSEIPYCDTRENVCARACVSGQYLQQAQLGSD